MKYLEKDDKCRRQAVIESVANSILRLEVDGVTVVGINGVDGSGKTTFAAELVEQLEVQTDREVLSFSIDDFHNPQTERYRKGELSAQGFYEDSFNKKALIKKVLHPLKQGARRYQQKHFDHRLDVEVDSPTKEATPDAIAIIEGVFLFTVDLVKFFDYKIFLHADFENTMQRGITRDIAIDSKQKVEMREKYLKRYIPGQKLYLEENSPMTVADLVIENTNFVAPKILL